MSEQHKTSDTASGRIFNTLEANAGGDGIGRLIYWSMMLVIALNGIAVILESMDYLYVRYSSLFKWFEIVSVAIFTIEYIFRLVTCTSSSAYSHPLRGRLKYSFTFLALVDLLAILPFYLPFIIAVDLRFLRVLRLLRLLKFGRYSQSLQMLGRVFRQKKHELLVSGFIVVILLILASSMMYFVEREAQPDAFGSIPSTMWWGIATLTTVGYGDIYPITPLGKVIGAIIALLGIGMFALPAGILASGFAEALKEKTNNCCPHCGKRID